MFDRKTVNVEYKSRGQQSAEDFSQRNCRNLVSVARDIPLIRQWHIPRITRS